MRGSVVKAEGQPHRGGFERPPDRVAFVANSHKDHSRNKAGNAAAAVGKREKTEREEDEEVKVIGGSVKAGPSSSADEAKSGAREERADSDDEVMEEGSGADGSRSTPRYPPIGLPLHTDGTTSSPPLSTAAVVTDADSGHLLFFQLPSHLPLQPTLFPSPPAASSTLPPRAPGAPTSRPPSDSLPDTKDPSLLLASASSSSSLSYQSKMALQKRLLTFHPSFENSLRWVKPGEVGRLLLMKSGRVKLEIGGVRLDVDRGMECDYHQQVVSIHAEGAAAAAAAAPAATATAAGGTGAAAPVAGGHRSAEGEEGKQDQQQQQQATPAEGRKEWIELGEVRQRLVCTLDVDDLVRQRAGVARLTEERDDDSAQVADHTQPNVRVKKERE